MTKKKPQMHKFKVGELVWCPIYPMRDRLVRIKSFREHVYLGDIAVLCNEEGKNWVWPVKNLVVYDPFRQAIREAIGVEDA